MSRLISRAREFACRAHDGIDHRRKYTHEPYTVHLQAVAETVASVTADEEMIAAAWLHDVVEDTPATLAEVEAAFGVGVAALVAELTDVSTSGDGNRERRKALDHDHAARASPRAQTIRLADLIDNVASISLHSPRFARVYVPEKESLLEVLGEGDRTLFERARRVLEEARTRL